LNKSSQEITDIKQTNEDVTLHNKVPPIPIDKVNQNFSPNLNDNILFTTSQQIISNINQTVDPNSQKTTNLIPTTNLMQPSQNLLQPNTNLVQPTQNLTQNLTQSTQPTKNLIQPTTNLIPTPNLMQPITNLHYEEPIMEKEKIGNENQKELSKKKRNRGIKRIRDTEQSLFYIEDSSEDFSYIKNLIKKNTKFNDNDLKNNNYDEIIKLMFTIFSEKITFLFEEFKGYVILFWNM